MLYGICINGFEAWKFQNACCCHGNCKNTQFNSGAPTTLKSEGEVTSLSGADKREVRDNREKW